MDDATAEAKADAKARMMLGRSTAPPIIVAVVLLIVAVCMTWAGGFLLYQYQTGARTTAKVDDCDVSYNGGRYVYCTGSWTVGGTPASNGGHTVVGSVEGADTDDIGKTIDVTLSRDGQTAYTRDPKLGIAILVIGLIIGVGFFWWARLMLRARKAPAT